MFMSAKLFFFPILTVPFSKDHQELEKKRRLLFRKLQIWQYISENVITHRPRKRWLEDDIMVCQCKPVPGCKGCGPKCLNRLLNIECVAVRVGLQGLGVQPARSGSNSSAPQIHCRSPYLELGWWMGTQAKAAA